MPKSLSQILIHIVFHVKEGSAIHPQHAGELYNYLGGIIKQNDSFPIRIGGTEDHIHILCSLSKTLTVAKLVEEIKRNSSRWIKTVAKSYRYFSWQRGYGAFSVSSSHRRIVIEYINNQKKHHLKRTFQEEFELLLEKYNVEYNKEYLWKD
ncbi:MAG: transposase [Tannerellaceae bacterium]|nr:transposase [Tannerellaceae bacterium]